jgi:hypothetical protein
MTLRSQRSADSIVGQTALICGVLGVVAGFVRGLTVYAPTAWAAALAVGVPAAVVGGILGSASSACGGSAPDPHSQ